MRATDVAAAGTGGGSRSRRPNGGSRKSNAGGDVTRAAKLQIAQWSRSRRDGPAGP